MIAMRATGDRVHTIYYFTDLGFKSDAYLAGCIICTYTLAPKEVLVQ